MLFGVVRTLLECVSSFRVQENRTDSLTHPYLDLCDVRTAETSARHRVVQAGVPVVWARANEHNARTCSETTHPS